MSELAAAYYHERADRLGINDVPAILDGAPITLFEPSQAVSVHRPELEPDSPAVVTLRKNLGSIRSFLLACTPDDERYPKETAGVITGKNNQLTSLFVGKLLVPSTTKTGKIDDVQFEAISREEVPDPTLKRIKGSSYGSLSYNALADDTEAYFAVTGRLRSGSRQAIVGGILIARTVHAMVSGNRETNFYATDVHYGGTPLRSNEASGQLLLRESRIVSEAVTEHRMRTAYINPAGTSRRARGSR